MRFRIEIVNGTRELAILRVGMELIKVLRSKKAGDKNYLQRESTCGILNNPEVYTIAVEQFSGLTEDSPLIFTIVHSALKNCTKKYTPF